MLDRLTLFELVGRKLDYAEQRHTVIARNLANADTPGFVPHDVVEPDFRRLLQGRGVGAVTLASSHPSHLSGTAAIAHGLRQRELATELKPSGNAVSLDIEAARLRSNSGQHRLATVIYGKYMTMMRAALGQS